MPTLQELATYLKNNKACFEIIEQSAPIISTQDARPYFDITFAAPVLVVEADQEMTALITSARRGKVDFKELGTKFGFTRLKLADKKKIESISGYKIGTLPLVGLELPCIFDNSLLKFEYIYGGSGNELHTLKIDPRDVKRLNRTTFTFD